MKPIVVLAIALLISACAMRKPVAAVQPQPRVAILDVQKAVLSTEDGKAASIEMHDKFDPEQRRLANEQQEIRSLRSQLSGDDGRIAALEQSYRRKTEQAREKFETERQRVFKELVDKLMVVVGQYAKQNHFEVVLDISDPKTPVVWSAGAADITDEVIELYGQVVKKR